MGNLDRAFDVKRYQQVSLFYERRLTKVLNQNPTQSFGQPKRLQKQSKKISKFFLQTAQNPKKGSKFGPIARKPRKISRTHEIKNPDAARVSGALHAIPRFLSLLFASEKYFKYFWVRLVGWIWGRFCKDFQLYIYISIHYILYIYSLPSN